ncbi:hypothetical protein WG66_013164 [Moniliophthora roreri]|nr:hypothetical protein WG66_013164 [Moniliophthora roreri]
MSLKKFFKKSPAAPAPTLNVLQMSPRPNVAAFSQRLPATPTSTTATATMGVTTALSSVPPATSLPTLGSAAEDMSSINRHLPSDVTNKDAILGGTKTALKVGAAAAEAVPVVGTTIKCAIGAILEIFTVIEQISDNNEEILLLTWNLRDLIQEIDDIQKTMPDKERDQVYQKLSSLYQLLNQLQGKWKTKFAAETVSKTLRSIKSQIDSILIKYTALSQIESRQILEEICIFSIGVTVRDAAGRRFPISTNILLQPESVGDYLKFLFQYPKEDDKEISRKLLGLMEWGQYSLFIVKNGQVIRLGNSKKEWQKIEPGSEIVMSAIVWQKKEDDNSVGYRCPVCKEWNGSLEHKRNKAEDCSNSECHGRFQAIEGEESTVAKASRWEMRNVNVNIMKNIHIIQVSQ